MPPKFLEGQPDPAAVEAVLDQSAIHLSVLLFLDFLGQPVRICNRTLPFVDLRDGFTWEPGAGLLVAFPEVNGGEGELAPFREYSLGIPGGQITEENWRADLVTMVANPSDYRGRNMSLQGQLFNPDTGAAVGHPFAFETGLMDRLSASFQVGGAVLTLSVESFLARKGVPVYGMLTYRDQQRRYPGDEGLEFVPESDQLVTWTNW